MKIYVICKARRSYSEIGGHQISETQEAVFGNIKKAKIRVKELNSKKIQHEVYFLTEKEVLPVHDEPKQTVLLGKRFKVIHPKLKPVIFEFINGVELRDKKDTFHIKDIQSLLDASSKKEGNICIGREMADIIKETISNYNNRLKIAVNE